MRLLLGIGSCLALCGGAGASWAQPAFVPDPGIVKQLRERGIVLHRVAAGKPFVFRTRTFVYTTSHGELHLFRFASTRLARSAAARVRPSGYAIARSRGGEIHVDWVAPPHWFRSGETIVLYLGTSKRVLRLLREVVGPQFAGSSRPP